MSNNSSPALKRWNHMINETDAAYHEAARILGLTDSSCKILYMLYTNDNACLLNDLYNQTGTCKQTINSALRKLEADGIVVTEQFSGRKKKVYLTEKGRTFANNTIAHMVNMENEILNAMSGEDLEILLSLTQRYLTHFKEKLQILPERMQHENSTL